MKMPDLRNGDFSGKAVHVDDTPMLNTTARETPETQKATNTNKEDTNKTPSFGTLGARGRN